MNSYGVFNLCTGELIFSSVDICECEEYAKEEEWACPQYYFGVFEICE